MFIFKFGFRFERKWRWGGVVCEGGLACVKLCACAHVCVRVHMCVWGGEGLQGVTRMAYSPRLWLMAIGW